ncbi:alpha/beta hydrolase [Streptomyces sp. NPDC051976]|uniref:alpha/beta fold hydrolase n=1 Tax=Streptomyces sp. NPDC051976 TaxID=3154947 RepID=UPI00343E61C9
METQESKGIPAHPQPEEPSSPERLIVRSADGTEIVVHKRGNGPGLVIAHGALSTAEDWAPLSAALASRVTTYTIERRGYTSAAERSSHSMEREQEDLLAVADAIGGAYLLGHSYAAIVALEAALAGPLHGLIAYEPPLPLDRPIGGPALPVYEAAVDRGDYDGALEIGLAEFVRLPKDQIAAFRQFMPERWDAMARFTPSWVREVAAIDATNLAITRYAEIACPTAVVTGTVSPQWLQAVAARLVDNVPHSRLITIADHAHEAHLSATDLLASEIASFIDATRQ